MSESPTTKFALVTRDIALASVLRTRSYEPTLCPSSDGPVDFLFSSEKEDLSQVQKDFYQRRLLVEPRAFYECWRTLRKRLDGVVR
jgi:hypothetical protein